MKLPPSRRCLPPVQRLLLLKVCNQAPAFRSPLSRLSRSLPPMPVPPADFTPPCGCPSGGCAVNTVRRFRPRFAVALRLTEGTGSTPLHLPFRSFRSGRSATFPLNLPPMPVQKVFSAQRPQQGPWKFPHNFCGSFCRSFRGTVFRENSAVGSIFRREMLKSAFSRYPPDLPSFPAQKSSGYKNGSGFLSDAAPAARIPYDFAGLSLCCTGSDKGASASCASAPPSSCSVLRLPALPGIRRGRFPYPSKTFRISGSGFFPQYVPAAKASAD